jgi:hypothetical protein
MDGLLLADFSGERDAKTGGGKMPKPHNHPKIDSLNIGRLNKKSLSKS